MPIDSSAVGATMGPSTRTVDPRWAMEYAAALGDDLDVYLDTTRPDGILTHPVFPVCLEWATSREAALPGLAPLRDDEGAVGVHFDQDIVMHRVLRAGDQVSLSAQLVEVARRRSGALHVLRFDAVDARGRAVWTSVQRALFIGGEIDGPDQRSGHLPEPPERLEDDEVLDEFPLSVTRLTSQLYTSGSRIWNPIHTDERIARAAGLPGVILHGTATLALAVSRLLANQAPERPDVVRRVYGRFSAPVPLPTELRVRLRHIAHDAEGRTVRFDVLTHDDQPAIRDGLLRLGVAT